MSVKGFLRQVILNFDFFPTTQFLRYKGQSSYRTLTGGVFTIIIVAVFFWLFASALMDILNKNNVTLETNIHHHAIPEPTNVTFGTNGGFMFAISIGGMNLSRTDLKYFDIGLSLNQFVPVGQLVTSTPIPLQMCTQNHFNFNQQLANDYYNLNGSNLLCPQLNFIAEIRGRATSDIFQRLTVTIKKCNASLSANCASDAMVQQLQNSLGYFGLGVILVNTQLNPSQPSEYKQFYLDDKNYFPFTTSLAIKARASISQYKIWTDDSIYPYSNSFTERGLRIPDYFLYNTIPVLSDTYAVIHFQKSCIFTTYSRSFRKIDTLFSYVGGLIGTILGFIFVLNSYNELCFKLSLGRQLCTDDDQQSIKSENFNFLYYIGYLLYQIVKKITCCKNEKGKMHIFTKCQQQMHKQLDIVLLMKKIIYFQRYIEQMTKANPISQQLKHSKIPLPQWKGLREGYRYGLQQQNIDSNPQQSDQIDKAKQYTPKQGGQLNQPNQTKIVQKSNNSSSPSNKKQRYQNINEDSNKMLRQNFNSITVQRSRQDTSPIPVNMFFS